MVVFVREDTNVGAARQRRFHATSISAKRTDKEFSPDETRPFWSQFGAAPRLCAHHLDQAVEFLRRAGTLHRLPLALLARATSRDLDEVFRIATRSGMWLYRTDYHRAKGNWAEAEQLLNETDHHRRDAELQKLKQSAKRS